MVVSQPSFIFPPLFGIKKGAYFQWLPETPGSAPVSWSCSGTSKLSMARTYGNLGFDILKPQDDFLVILKVKTFTGVLMAQHSPPSWEETPTLRCTMSRTWTRTANRTGIKKRWTFFCVFYFCHMFFQIKFPVEGRVERLKGNRHSVVQPRRCGQKHPLNLAMSHRTEIFEIF